MNIAEDVKVTLRKEWECSAHCVTVGSMQYVSHVDWSEKSQEDIQPWI